MMQCYVQVMKPASVMTHLEPYPSTCLRDDSEQTSFQVVQSCNLLTLNFIISPDIGKVASDEAVNTPCVLQFTCLKINIGNHDLQSLF